MKAFEDTNGIPDMPDRRPEPAQHRQKPTRGFRRTRAGQSCSRQNSARGQLRTSLQPLLDNKTAFAQRNGLNPLDILPPVEEIGAPSRGAPSPGQNGWRLHLQRRQPAPSLELGKSPMTPADGSMPWEQNWAVPASVPVPASAPPQQTPAAPPPPIAAPYDPDFNIARNPDGSIKTIGTGISTQVPGQPEYFGVTGDQDRISAFLAKHPEDPANQIGKAPPAPVAATSAVIPPDSETPPWALPWAPQASDGPDPNTPQGAALISARQGSAAIPAAIRSPVQGAFFNFGDEIAGAGAWAGTALGNLVNSFTGHKPDQPITPQQSYDATVQAEREQQDAFSKAHPWENAGMEAAGSMVNPINWAGGGFIGGARSIGSAAVRSAMVGGALGAAYGAGDGTDVGSRAVRCRFWRTDGRGDRCGGPHCWGRDWRGRSGHGLYRRLLWSARGSRRGGCDIDAWQARGGL